MRSGLVGDFFGGDLGDGEGEVVVEGRPRDQWEDDVELDGLSGGGGTSKELISAVHVGCPMRSGRSMHDASDIRKRARTACGLLIII
jgi:hypothetical protein